MIHCSIASSTADRAEFSFSVAGKVHDCFLEANQSVLNMTPTALVPPTLLASLATGEEIEMEGPVSKSVLANIGTLQEIYACWHPWMKKVPVRIGESAPVGVPSENRVGMFFSGGLDSFYTLIKNQSEITHLIFHKTFDGDTEKPEIQQLKLEQIYNVAQEFGKEVVELDSNLRVMLRDYGAWGLITHGTFLHASAIALSPSFRKIFIAAPMTYATLLPTGVHPLIDPLFSTEGTQLVHDGCEATRVQKAAFVSDSEIAMRTLRVCFEHRGGHYNCGVCEKCVRTQINFLVAGSLDRCKSFHKPLTPQILRGIRTDSETKVAMMRDSLRTLEERNERPDIQKAMRFVLKRSRRTSWDYQLRRMAQRSSFMRRVIRRMNIPRLKIG